MSREDRWVRAALLSAAGFLCATLGRASGRENAIPPAVPLGPPAPVAVVAGSGKAVPAAVPMPLRDEGLATSVAILEPDDAVPLPEPAVILPGALGDTVVAPARGNPYYLGFAAGRYEPPASERFDPALGDALVRLGGDGRPRGEVYGYIMLAKRLTGARLAELEALGVRALGMHPHYSLRAAIPAESLPAVAALESVRWVGVPRAWQKIHPRLTRMLASAGAERIPVYVSVFDSDLCAETTWQPGPAPSFGGPDAISGSGAPEPQARRATSNGWMQRAIEREGLLVGGYLPQQQVFLASATGEQVARLAALDFVQFVEAKVDFSTLHEESMPMVHADLTRIAFDGNTNQKAIVGIVDTGVDVSHSMLDHVWWLQWNESASPTGGNVDACGHGSHVAGTILGEPIAPDSELRGVAPALATFDTGRLRIVKAINETISCQMFTFVPALAYTHFHGTWTSGSQTSAPPVVINNSWGAGPLFTSGWFGTEVEARVVDDEVFGQDQVYVFAAGNDGPNTATIGLPAVAKNALTVGAVQDFVLANEEPGALASFSSRGPCADGRWKPNVVAPGQFITSADANSGNGYAVANGTSMAAPHVTGVVAQMADHWADLSNNPARVMSLMQATAITRNNQVLTTPGESHLDEFGCGRVNAFKAQNNSSQFTTLQWSNTVGGFAPPWFHGDFTVPPGTQRVVVCMTYVEPSASGGSSKSLVNDWDLYIDQSPIDTVNGNTGDFTAQQSSVDNTEIRSLNFPASGNWRWKAWPKLHSPFSTVKLTVTVHLCLGDTTPSGTLTLTPNYSAVKLNQDLTVTAMVTADSQVASAVFLDSNLPSFASLAEASTFLADGTPSSLVDNFSFGRDLMLGDILHGTTRSAAWRFSSPFEGTWPFTVNARSDNLDDLSATINVVVDGTPPAVPSGLSSPTHSTGVWSSNPNVGVQWQSSVETLSGLMGYSYAASVGAPVLPDQSAELGPVNSVTHGYASSASGQYFAIRPVDNAGNWNGSYASIGPFLVDAVDPGLVGSLISSTHAPNVWSNNATIAFKWAPAPEAHSGIDGYSLSISLSPSAPDLVKDVGAVSDYATTLPTSPSGRYFNIRSVDVAGNWDDEYEKTGPYFIDVLAPGGPKDLASPSHPLNAWSSNPTIQLTWTAASDGDSGVAGYDTLFDDSPGTIPAGGLDELPGSTGKSGTVAASSSGWYFHARAKDVAGNWGTTQHLGPFLIDNATPPDVSGLTSTTHVANSWSTSGAVTMKWNAVTDSASGIAGYSYSFDPSPTTAPDATVDTLSTTVSTSLGGTTGIYFHVRPKDAAGNLGNTAHFGPLLIDDKPPTGPSGLSSPSHVIGAPSTNVNVTIQWTASVDAEYSGVAGYDTEWDHVPNTVPAGIVDTAASATSKTTVLSVSTQDWWFHIRARDNAGNLGDPHHLGPFKIGLCTALASNATYGSGKPGSLGVPLLVPLDNPVLGTTSTVELQNAKPGALPILFLGVSPLALPFDGGQLLVNPVTILSIPVPVLASGKLPLTGILPPDPTLCGLTLCHQVMFTDPGATGFYHLAMTAGLARTFGF